MLTERRAYTLLEPPTEPLTPSQFHKKWVRQFHYVTSRLPGSPITARSLYIMPFKIFSHILDLLLEFDAEAVSLTLCSGDFLSEKPSLLSITSHKKNNGGRNSNPFATAEQLRQAITETLEFCEETLGYFPDHTRMDPRSPSRVMREEGQLVELIGRIEEARGRGVWGGGSLESACEGRRRSWRRRMRMWLRRVGGGRAPVWWSGRTRVWCL